MLTKIQYDKTISSDIIYKEKKMIGAYKEEREIYLLMATDVDIHIHNPTEYNTRIISIYLFKFKKLIHLIQLIRHQ